MGKVIVRPEASPDDSIYSGELFIGARFTTRAGHRGDAPPSPPDDELVADETETDPGIA